MNVTKNFLTIQTGQHWSSLQSGEISILSKAQLEKATADVDPVLILTSL